MSDHLIFVKITGDPFLARAKQYQADMIACSEAWHAFKDEMGAHAVTGSFSGLCFNRDAPDGWTKPKGKYGFSSPKKGHPDCDRIAALPKRIGTHDIFGDAVLYCVSYEFDGGNGSRGIGLQFEPYVFWVGDDFFAKIPDAKAAADHHYNSDGPGFRITNGADAWALPTGLERVSEARLDLLIAQHNLALEEAQAVTA